MFGYNLRFIVNILLILFCCSLNLYLNDVKKSKNCPLNKDWRLNNGITLLNLLFAITVINLFLPLHNFLYALPLIGSWYIFIFAIWIFIILYIVTYISNQIKENIEDTRYNKCVTPKTKVMYGTFKNNTTITCIMISPIFTMLYFYAIKN
jgi:hypothetical protein